MKEIKRCVNAVLILEQSAKLVKLDSLSSIQQIPMTNGGWNLQNALNCMLSVSDYPTGRRQTSKAKWKLVPTTPFIHMLNSPHSI